MKWILRSSLLSLIMLALGVSAFPQHVIATIPVSSNPLFVAINQKTNRIYVTQLGLVSVIDGKTNKVVTTVRIGTTDSELGPPVTYPPANQIFVPDYTDQALYVIDGKTNFAQPLSLWYGNWSAELGLSNWIYEAGGGSVNVADANNKMNVVVTIPVVGGAGQIATDAIRQRAYVETGSIPAWAITVIDTSTNTVVNSFPVGNNVNFWAMSFDPVSNQLYAGISPLHSFDGTVLVFDASTGEPLGTTQPLAEISGVIALPGMGKFVVAGGKRVGGQPPKRLTFVDGSTFEVVSRLKVGSEPGSMAYNSATKTLYVCNYADNTISVIGN